MMFLLTTIFAAGLFALVTTRPGMRILTEWCPNFFDRMDDIFMLGMKEGVYNYSLDIGRTREEELQFETELLLPLMGISAGLALAISWVAALFGCSTFACLVLSFVASLLPFGFGLAVLGVMFVMLRFPRLFGADITDNAGRYVAPSSDSEPYTVADRAYDFVVDRGEELKAFKENPRSLMNLLDGLYDAARARLARKRETTQKFLPRSRPTPPDRW